MRGAAEGGIILGAMPCSWLSPESEGFSTDLPYTLGHGQSIGSSFWG